jgi:F0F1-type ATP synthase assembly protein I
MSPNDQPPDKNRAQYIFNLTMAAVAGQVGFLTLLIVLIAMFGGLWLDKVFGTKPFLTIVLVLASVPVTLVMMFWVVRNAIQRIKPTQPEKTGSHQEVSDRGEDA